MSRTQPFSKRLSLLAMILIGVCRFGAVADDAPKSRDPGGAALIGAAATATVKSVDADKRSLTLQTTDGDLIDVKCGKEVRNFDQIRVGDQVRAVAVAHLVVAVGVGGDAAKPEAGVVVARSPKGAKPGAIIASTEQMTAKVQSVDAAKQTVTLKADAGEAETIAVAPDVDLSKVKPGDAVTARVTKGIALWVATPEDAARPAAEKLKPDAESGGEGFVLDATTASATVEAVDPAKRTVTLKGPAGSSRSIHLGPECVNFDQIKVGDQVHTTVAEEVAISVRKAGEEPAPGEAAGTSVALAPKGGKPGMFITDTDLVSAKVKAMDAGKKTITLTEADGGTRTVKAGPGVNLANLKEGDEVTARVTQAMAIVVQTPR